MKVSRPLYRHADLQRMLSPRNVAIIGVSPNALSFGARATTHLERFRGSLYRVNPKYDRIGENRCYDSIASLPEIPDCVVIAVPRDGVEAAVVECANRGVGGVVIFASSYAETGTDDGIVLQERLSAIARQSGLRIIGPNCMGFMNLSQHLVASFVGSAVPLESTGSSGIGLISQSGSIGFSMSQAMYAGVTFSHVITSGNSCDVTVADAMAYLAEEPSCKVIACVFEGLANPTHIIEAGEIAWKANKPVVIFKLGVGEQGALATMSHTASLAGSFEAYKAAFERTGMVMVEDFKSLIETAAFFMKAPRPISDGVAVVSGSGGMAIAHADMAEKHGVSLPQPVDETRKKVMQFIPDFGVPRNPIDATAMAGRNEGHVGCLDVMLADPMYSVGIFPQPLFQPSTLNRFKLMSEVSQRHRKPICIVWANGWTGGPGTKEVESDPNLALFQSIDRCLETLASWFKREKHRQAWEKQRKADEKRLTPERAGAAAGKLFDACSAAILTEREAKEVLSQYGVPVVGEKLVQSAEQAVTAASALGFPVAMKLESPDVPHKTEAGVVKLNLRSREDVEAAYRTIMDATARIPGDPHVNGVLVQPMVSAGLEIMVGAKIDPLFGPLIVVGLGGIFVEVLKDTIVELAPVGKVQARAMLDRLKGRTMLDGFRGGEPVDIDALSEVIVRISEFASDCRDRLESLDVNPLICAGKKIVAVDALIAKSGPKES